MNNDQTEVSAVESLPLLTVDTSADAKRNAYSFHCLVTEQRRNYAVCLHLCAQRLEGRLGILYSDCSIAINGKRCPALGMRKAEIAKGEPLFFEERLKGDLASSARTNAYFATRSAKSKPAKSTVSKPLSVIGNIDTGGYETAINAAVKVQITIKPASTPVAVKSVGMKAGESLLDLAKRLMGK